VGPGSASFAIQHPAIPDISDSTRRRGQPFGFGIEQDGTATFAGEERIGRLAIKVRPGKIAGRAYYLVVGELDIAADLSTTEHVPVHVHVDRGIRGPEELEKGFSGFGDFGSAPASADMSADVAAGPPVTSSDYDWCFDNFFEWEVCSKRLAAQNQCCTRKQQRFHGTP